MEAFMWEFILIIILLAIILISLIIFILFCCMCKKNNGEEGAGKSCVTVGCILFWLIVILFVIFFVFVIMAATEMSASQCGIMDSSVMLLFGSKNTKWEFYGISNVSSLFGNFTLSQTKFSQVQNNFNNIFLARV
ncbi:MAG: hypothetical protein GY938_16440 [Ketobacter sp.]|nr:hypothetical protein [Ketobacter sp.]